MKRAVGTKNGAEAAELSRRLQEQRANLKDSFEADTRRSIVEEGRSIRQEISRIKNRPENVGAVLAEESDRLSQDYDSIARPRAPQSTNDRLDALGEQVREALRHGRAADARRSHAECGPSSWPRHRRIRVFKSRCSSRSRGSAISPSIRRFTTASSTDGQACIDRNDLDGLRRAIGSILENQIPTDAKKAASAALAGLMK